MSVSNFTLLACLEVPRLVRLARLARLAKLVGLCYVSYVGLVSVCAKFQLPSMFRSGKII